MEFYPVTPETPRYSISTPRFDDLVLNLPSGHKLHILAPGAQEGKSYIKSIRLNGVLIHRRWLFHSEITGDGTLDFEMSALPVAP